MQLNEKALDAAAIVYGANERLAPTGRARGSAEAVIVAYFEALSVAEREAGTAPAQFLFGFDDPFGDGGLYVWIVAEDFFKETGFVDDSSSASSVIPESVRNNADNDYDYVEVEKKIDEANLWLSRATDGVLQGEAMESCWGTSWETEHDKKLSERLYGDGYKDPNEGKTRDQVMEEIKAALIARGFKHEPKLEEVNG